MTPSHQDLIGRDVEAIERDFALLAERIGSLSAARDNGDMFAAAARAISAEEPARRIHARLHEIGLQAASIARRVG